MIKMEQIVKLANPPKALHLKQFMPWMMTGFIFLNVWTSKIYKMT